MEDRLLSAERIGDDAILHIFYFLELEELMICRHVCKQIEEYCTYYINRMYNGVDDHSWRPHVCTFIVNKGYLNLMTWAREFGYELWEYSLYRGRGSSPTHIWKDFRSVHSESSSMEIAANKGHALLLFWMMVNRGNQTIDGARIIAAAAEGGQRLLVELLVAVGFQWDEKTIQQIVRNGDVEFLRWADSNGAPWGRDVGKFAVISGSLDMVVHVYQSKGYEVFPEIFQRFASTKGNLQILDFLYENNFPMTYYYTVGASMDNQFEALKWLYAKGYPLNDHICIHAARNGNLEMLEWAHQRSCRMNAKVISAAAQNRHLNIIKWAYDNGCPFDKEACEKAAYNGDLDTLRWLRRHLCPWSAKVRWNAHHGKHQNVLKWAEHNGCDFETPDATEFFYSSDQIPDEEPIFFDLEIENDLYPDVSNVATQTQEEDMGIDEEDLEIMYQPEFYLEDSSVDVSMQTVQNEEFEENLETPIEIEDSPIAKKQKKI